MTDSEQKPETAKSLSEALEAFAIHMVNEMQKDGVPFAQKLDAFKSVTNYYSTTAKAKVRGGGEPEADDPPAAEGFQAVKDRIRVVGGGKPDVGAAG